MMESSASSTGPGGRFLASVLRFFGILILLLNGCSLPLKLLAPTPTGTQSVSTQLPDTALPPTSTLVVPIATASVGPPPPPARPQIGRGAPNGDNQKKFRIFLDFSPDYFLRVYVFYSNNSKEQFDPAKDGRGIKSVEFTVTSPNGDTTYWHRTENTPGYCIFGGGEPVCNPWTYEGGQYFWKPGGPSVHSGKYALTITVTPRNGDGDGTWLWDSQDHNLITINVP
jgi:hypothetical protein